AGVLARIGLLAVEEGAGGGRRVPENPGPQKCVRRHSVLSAFEARSRASARALRRCPQGARRVSGFLRDMERRGPRRSHLARRKIRIREASITNPSRWGGKSSPRK